MPDTHSGKVLALLPFEGTNIVLVAEMQKSTGTTTNADTMIEKGQMMVNKGKMMKEGAMDKATMMREGDMMVREGQAMIDKGNKMKEGTIK